VDIVALATGVRIRETRAMDHAVAFASDQREGHTNLRSGSSGNLVLMDVATK